MRFFPKVDPAGPIDAEVRASAVDYVNRVNWLFETRDLPGMIASFTSDARIVHFHGTLSGEDEVRHFLTEHYPYLVPGVGRCACNHIVDMEASGAGRRSLPESSGALRCARRCAKIERWPSGRK